MTSERPFPRHCGCDHLVIRTEMKNGHPQETIVRKTTSEMSNTTNARTSGSDNEHSRLSPSSAGRWSRCTAGPALEAANKDKLFLMAVQSVVRLTSYLESLPAEELKDHEKRAIKLAADIHDGKVKVAKLTKEQQKDIWRSEGSVASRSGTRAHDWAAWIFEGKKTRDQIPEELRFTVEGYVDHCLALVPEGERPYIESEVNLRHSPGDTGTSDFDVWTEEIGYLRDLKAGSGKLVRNVDNEQFALYAVNRMRDLEDDGLMSFGPDYVVNIRAYQPNHHEAADLKPWIITRKDLEDFVRPIEEAAAKVRSGKDTVFYASEDTCGAFCPVRSMCSARAEYLTSVLDNPDASYSGVDLLAELPDDDEIPDTTKKAFRAQPVVERLISRLEFASNGRVSALTDDQMVALWSNSSAIGKLLEDIEEHLKARVLGGEKIEGLKCVYGRSGDRKWKDEKAVMTFLRGQGLKKDEYTEEKLLGPAKVEKIPALAEKMENVKRTATTFANLISRSDAKKTIATLDDSRPEVSSLVDELPDEEEEDIDEEAMLG